MKINAKQQLNEALLGCLGANRRRNGQKPGQVYSRRLQECLDLSGGLTNY